MYISESFFPVLALLADAVVCLSTIDFFLIFGLSWSLGVWLLISEIYPNRIRAVAMSFAFASMYLANFIVTRNFPIMKRSRELMDHFHGAFPLMLCVVCSGLYTDFYRKPGAFILSILSR
ncbi:MFS transporter [Klebsiella variicola]|uniref:MFS transporter n=1 Tax=Klebsiella variicola TaxID=244366 RepID=UPI003D99988F